MQGNKYWVFHMSLVQYLVVLSSTTILALNEHSNKGGQCVNTQDNSSQWCGIETELQLI